MQASTVVEPLDIVGEVFASVCFGGVNGPVDALVFERREERLHHTVVPSHAGASHRGLHAQAGH